jgi:deoxyadenosine/deoxycytidine kinase
LLFRHIAIEGPPGVGKTVLAERLSARFDATAVLDERENPFLHEFYQGRTGAAFQAQLFFTLARYRQQGGLRQSDLFSQLLIANYLFDRDKIYAYVNLDDNELFIYQRLYDLIAPDVPPPIWSSICRPQSRLCAAGCASARKPIRARLCRPRTTSAS